MRNRGVIKWLLLTIVGGTLVACGQATADRAVTGDASSLFASNCRTIQHEVGETEVCDRPERIIALGPYLLEALLAFDIQPAGFGDHISLHRGPYDNPSQQIPYLGDSVSSPLINVGSAFSPSIESIVKVQPDLIVGTDSNASQYEALSQIAPTILLKWADTQQTLRAIGQAVGQRERAEALLTETEQTIAAARETFAPLVASYPKVMLLSTSQLQDIRLGNSAHGLCSSLLEALGFQLVTPSGFAPTNPSMPVSISIETLPQLNEADSVILLGYNFSELSHLQGAEQFKDYQVSNLKQTWERNAIAQSLNASKAERVYFIPSYLCLGLPGPIGTELYLNELKQQMLTDF